MEPALEPRHGGPSGCAYRPRGAARALAPIGPASTTRPWRSTVTRSVTCAITPMSWVISTRPIPRSSTSRRISASTCDCTGDVEGGGRLVGDDELGIGAQSERDDDALAHAAGELVRIGLHPPLGVADAGLREKRRGPFSRRIVAEARLVREDRLDELRLDRHQRVQARLRILEDHRDSLAAGGVTGGRGRAPGGRCRRAGWPPPRRGRARRGGR